MTIDKNTPCVKCSDRLLTIAEAEKALEHASAFIMLAQSVEPHQFSVAAGEWFSSYGVEGKGMRE
jgi:hypothetical protein